QAQDRLERISDQLKIAEGITEALKARDPMAWVQRMNNIHARAEEIIREELIFV
ncbi:MAG: TnpV protein, partial [Faecousia sp.]